jgi:membrane protein required for colicin V production
MVADLILALLVAGAFAAGWRSGLVRAVLGTVAVLVALVAAVQGSQAGAWWLRDHLGWEGDWLPLAGLVLVFVGVLVLFHLAGRLLEGLLKAVALGTVNRALGGVLYALAAALVLATVAWYLDAAAWLPPEATADSRLWPEFVNAAPALLALAGQAWPVLQDAYAELERFFAELAQRAPA